MLRTRRTDVLFYSILFAIAAFSQTPLVRGQFFGEDEPMQLFTCQRVIRAFSDWEGVQSLFKAGWAISSEYHPPLRFLLSLPGVLLFPGTEFGLRFGAIIVSLVMTYQIVQLGNELGGKRVGCASGFLVASSSVYNWTSMAFGWSVIVTALVACIRILRGSTLDLRGPQERVRFRKVNALVILAFLTNTGAILFFGATGLIYLYANRKRFFVLVKAAAPFVGFYALYYLYYFYVVPKLAYRTLGITTPFGQLYQNLARSREAHLNLASLWENFRAINGYFLPYLGLLLLGACYLDLFRRERRTLAWIAPYVLAWSFYLSGGTHQYFLLASIAILPFGIRALADHLPKRMFAVTVATLSLLFLAWNYFIFIRPYRELDFPSAALARGNADLGRQHNIVLPYREIGADAKRLLGTGERYAHDISGAFSLFYLKDHPSEYADSRYAGALNNEGRKLEWDAHASCYRIFQSENAPVRIAITAKAICTDQIDRTVDYAGSAIKLYLLKNGPKAPSA
jgi:hypothetical protein